MDTPDPRYPRTGVSASAGHTSPAFGRRESAGSATFPRIDAQSLPGAEFASSGWTSSGDHSPQVGDPRRTEPGMSVRADNSSSLPDTPQPHKGRPGAPGHRTQRGPSSPRLVTLRAGACPAGPCGRAWACCDRHSPARPSTGPHRPRHASAPGTPRVTCSCWDRRRPAAGAGRSRRPRSPGSR